MTDYKTLLEILVVSIFGTGGLGAMYYKLKHSSCIVKTDDGKFSFDLKFPKDSKEKDSKEKDIEEIKIKPDDIV